jgi:hypothetical protein
MGERQFGAAMRKVLLAGKLKNQPIGQYKNRTAKLGLVCTSA